MESGRIAEIGSHFDLLAAEGHYATLWNMQIRSNAEDDLNTDVDTPLNSIES
jgi:hypothetical protein